MEKEWKFGGLWGTEKQCGLRADLRVGFNGYPV